MTPRKAGSWVSRKVTDKVSVTEFHPPAPPPCEGDLAFNFDKGRLNTEGCSACLEHQVDWRAAQKRLLKIGYSTYRIEEGCPEPCGLELELHHDSLSAYHALIAAKDAEIAELRGFSELERGLTEFRKEMLAKFSLPRVVAKHGKSSVTIDGNLDKMDEFAVLSHFYEETQERWLSSGPENKAGEDVDVANMAFLDWWCQRRAALAPKSSAGGGGD